MNSEAGRPTPERAQSATAQPAVGFVGLGVMGSAMSGRLLAAGFPVLGYDVDSNRLVEHVDRGGLPAESPYAAAQAVDVLVTSLPSSEALSAVVDADDGIGAAEQMGLVVLETSTLSAADKTRARDRLATRRITLLDCPVSGTGAQAREGDLVAYLSGDPAAKTRAGPVLAAVTRNVHDLGAFGNGTAMKLIANHLVAIHNVAAAEALRLADRAGLDLDQVLAAVADGAGTSRMLEVRGPLMVEDRYLPATATVHTMLKDLGLITAFAAASGSATPVLDAAAAHYHDALASGRGDQDTACVYAVLRENGRAEPTALSRPEPPATVC